MAILGDNGISYRWVDFSAKVSRDGDRSVTVILAGELDLSTAADIRECLERPEVLDAERVTIDLTGVTFFDSTSTGLLVGACKRIRSTGGAFSVHCGNDRVLQVLELSGLVDLLEVTAASAVAPRVELTPTAAFQTLEPRQTLEAVGRRPRPATSEILEA